MRLVIRPRKRLWGYWVPRKKKKKKLWCVSRQVITWRLMYRVPILLFWWVIGIFVLWQWSGIFFISTFWKIKSSRIQKWWENTRVVWTGGSRAGAAPRTLCLCRYFVSSFFYYDSMNNAFLISFFFNLNIIVLVLCRKKCILLFWMDENIPWGMIGSTIGDVTHSWKLIGCQYGVLLFVWVSVCMYLLKK